MGEIKSSIEAEYERELIRKQVYEMLQEMVKKVDEKMEKNVSYVEKETEIICMQCREKMGVVLSDEELIEIAEKYGGGNGDVFQCPKCLGLVEFRSGSGQSHA